MKTLDPVELYPATPDNPCGFSWQPLDLDVDYFSYSRLKQLKKSPKFYKMRYIDGIKTETTPEMRFGRTTHSALCEPAHFRKNFMIEPRKRDYPDLIDTAEQLQAELKSRGMKTTAAKKADLERRLLEVAPELTDRMWKHIWSNHLAAVTDDSILLTNKEADTLKHMAVSLEEHPTALQTIRGGCSELCAYWPDDKYGVLWFTKLDHLIMVEENSKRMVWVSELKTTKDCSPNGFMKEVYDQDYHIQSWLYHRVVKGITGINPYRSTVAIEKLPPYICEVFKPVQRADEAAAWQVDRRLKRLNECISTGKWTGYTDGKKMVPMDIPNYAHWQIEEEAARELDEGGAQPSYQDQLKDIGV